MFLWRPVETLLETSGLWKVLDSFFLALGIVMDKSDRVAEPDRALHLRPFSLLHHVHALSSVHDY